MVPLLSDKELKVTFLFTTSVPPDMVTSGSLSEFVLRVRVPPDTAMLSTVVLVAKVAVPADMFNEPIVGTVRVPIPAPAISSVLTDAELSTVVQS
jgi:hypothetical protein